MKLFENAAKKLASSTASASSRSGDVQKSPVAVLLEAGEQPGRIKVDLCLHTGQQLIVAGWRTAPVQLTLQINGRVATARELKIDRTDVNKHFQLPTELQCGFVLTTNLNAYETDALDVQLQWKTPSGLTKTSTPMRMTKESKLTEVDNSALGPALLLFLKDMPFNSPAWSQLVAKIPEMSSACESANGFLESAILCVETQVSVVVGWLVMKPGIFIWLEDATGCCYSLDDAYRSPRQDVNAYINKSYGDSNLAGFVLHMQAPNPGSVLRLRAMTEAGIHTLSQIIFTTISPDPVHVASWLFGIPVPTTDFHDRVSLLDMPIIERFILEKQKKMSSMSETIKRLGKPLGNPVVSIIVPLFGRTDFVEHQILEFVKDDWLRENAELIYVIDDPALVASFTVESQELHRLYGMPFTFLWGQVNRGFSGANNLGAKHAQGSYLLFLNSDVFPQQSGWLKILVKEMQQRGDIGAIGPRLTFGHGSIQHAGMEFMRLDELSVWVNHHPYMGLDPSLDPRSQLTVVPAITGACLLIRRTHFDLVEGWDTGYLIGDFEDSDLCLKIREAGLSIAYLPSVQLTHLERQSFKLFGDKNFRTKVTLFNAVRHQKRWRHFFQDDPNNKGKNV